MSTEDMIKHKVQELYSKVVVQLDLNRQREDLYGLYSDIVSILHKQGHDAETLLYEYDRVLTQEEGFYDPQKAYEAGLHSTHVNQEHGLLGYLGTLYLNPANQAIIARRDRLFQELCTLLGEANGLITEFTELFRTCNGTIRNHIEQFYQMGLIERGALH